MSNHRVPNNPPADTTFTKIFVGGLAWETQRDTMRRYFEQFGEILEAVVIADKRTGRSKGYGFVTFKDPNAAVRACLDASPVIDGRRANCNLASLGATQRPRLPTDQAAFLHQASCYAMPYSLYGYAGGYSQDSGFYPYYAATSPGVLPSFYPYYTQYYPSRQPQGGFALHYPQMVQYPYVTPQLSFASGTVAVVPSSSQPPGNTLEQRPTT